MQRTNQELRRPPRARGALIRLGALALVLAIAAIVAYELGWFNYSDALRQITRLRRMHSLPVFATTFLVGSGLGMALGFPGLPFVVTAGALFGTLLGSVLGWTASMIGAVVGYWIARTVGHDVVVRWVKRFPHGDAAVSDARNFAGMLRLRLIPVLPIGVVNFIAGLARAPFARYLAATAIGIIPATTIYAYFAHSLLEGVRNGRREALMSLIVASALLLALSLTPAAMRWWKKRDARAHPKPSVPSHPHPSRRP
ncbi:MAG: TVP38/TMEM64 family protein [Gemmatimonadaceae bacterium]